MMRKKAYVLFLVSQSFLPPLSYTDFFFTLIKGILSSEFWSGSILKQFEIISDTDE